MKKILCTLLMVLFIVSCACSSNESPAPTRTEKRPEYKISYYEGDKLIKEYFAYDYVVLESSGCIKLYIDAKGSDKNRVFIRFGRVEINPN